MLPAPPGPGLGTGFLLKMISNRNARPIARVFYIGMLTFSAFGALVLDGSCVSINNAVPYHRSHVMCLHGGGSESSEYGIKLPVPYGHMV